MALGHRGGVGHTDSSYLKCLRFLLPNKLIADTLVNPCSCAACLSRDCFAFQTKPHNNSVAAGGVG